MIRTSQQDWLVVPNVVPAIVSAEDWEKVQVMVARRARARGGAGHRDRRWLLTGVLVCGECGHKFWGDPRRKGHVEGRAAVITNYYACAGRRSHGATICATPSTLRAEQLEAWVLGKLRDIVLMDHEAVDEAIERFARTAARHDPGNTDDHRIAREIKELNDLVTALTMNIDPANLPLLNDRLTQLRLRKECLERELHLARQEKNHSDVATLRTWARDQLAGLHDAMTGRGT